MAINTFTTIPPFDSSASEGAILRVLSGVLGFGKVLTKFITGTATNDNAAAGDIGEVAGPISRVRSAGLGITSGTNNNVCASPSITLTPGDWWVSGAVVFNPAATTNVTQYRYAVSKTTAAVPAADCVGVPTAGEYYGIFSSAASVPGADMVFTIPAYRVSVASNTTLYLVASASFSVSTLVVFGSLEARRAR